MPPVILGLDRIQADIDNGLADLVRREREAVRLADYREREARIAEGKARHAEIVAAQRPEPTFIDRSDFWNAVEADALAKGIPFVRPTREAAPPPPPAPAPRVDHSISPSAFGGPNSIDPAVLRAQFEKAVLGQQE